VSGDVLRSGAWGRAFCHIGLEFFFADKTGVFCPGQFAVQRRNTAEAQPRLVKTARILCFSRWVFVAFPQHLSVFGSDNFLVSGLPL
jgi:hypothetical protein